MKYRIVPSRFRKSTFRGCYKPRHVSIWILKFMSRLVACPPHFYIKMFPWKTNSLPWYSFGSPFGSPFVLLLNPCLNLLLDTLLEPLLDSLLNAHDFSMQCVMYGNSISNMGMLVTGTCYYSGNKVFGGVTIQDMSLNKTCFFLQLYSNHKITLYKPLSPRMDPFVGKKVISILF